MLVDLGRLASCTAGGRLIILSLACYRAAHSFGLHCRAGSGKSSFAKSLAASLASDDNRRPLLIELQRLKGNSSLSERIVDLLVEREELFRIDPLDKSYLDENRPLVFIFDGLDELAVPDTPGAKKIAEDFRVAVRGFRRDAIDVIKKAEKNKSISEDDRKREEEVISKVTNGRIKHIDDMLAAKEEEISTI